MLPSAGTNLTRASPLALVTGGAGYIGLHVVREMLDRGWRVRVLDLPAERLQHVPPPAEVCEGDIRSENCVRRALPGCDAVIHLAANPNLWLPDPREFETVNHLGARVVLEAAHQSGVRHIVFVSSETVLTHSTRQDVIDETTLPDLSQALGPYCRSKARAELAAIDLAARGGPVTVVTPTVPVGPGDWRRGPMTRLIEQFAAGRIRGVLDAEINLIDVRDVAAGIVRAVERGRPGARYLLGAENWTIQRLFEALSRLSGQPAPRFRVPPHLALGFAWIEERLCVWSRRQPIATVTGVRLARRRQRFNGERTRQALGLEFRSCYEALRETIDWLRRNAALRSEPPTPTLIPAASLAAARPHDPQMGRPGLEPGTPRV